MTFQIAYDIGTSEVASTEAQNPTTYNVAIEELLGEEQRLIAYTNVAQVGWAGIALSIAGCIYQNLGAHKLQKVFGDDLPLDIIRDALGGLRGKGLEGSEAVDGDVMKSALDAVVVMMGDVYWLVVWVGVIRAVFGLGMKWERVILDPELEGSRRYSVSYEAIV
ncbi:hypothetical protein OCU04_002288 [Sclerotinia nivalis]|uniref:Uncharacterized protein n=1 Tax=Sclerotinia nivalis TaxID=352851 RepID=A0A9X0AU19_9HELO|nr:hypothetical protein OCU04_002288 [Sclerotinia nivalis]